MSVNIKEVIVRANVGNPNQGGSNNAASDNNQEAVPKEEILKECIEQVMEIFKSKNER